MRLFNYIVFFLAITINRFLDSMHFVMLSSKPFEHYLLSDTSEDYNFLSSLKFAIAKSVMPLDLRFLKLQSASEQIHAWLGSDIITDMFYFYTRKIAGSQGVFKMVLWLKIGEILD